MGDPGGGATEALLAYEGGDTDAAQRLLPLVYGKLRALAGRYMRGEREGHTLQPTALVHEAYLRLVDVNRVEWRGKTHFFAMAARQMRRVLVEHARAAGRQKRGAGAPLVTLDERVACAPDRPDEILALDEALTRLAKLEPREARVAELRLFAGLSVKETAAELQVSERTVKSDWRFARVWLMRELGPPQGESPEGDDGP